jgi:hypothetical protein
MGHTEVQLLGFSYDFGVTVIHHQNDDVMVLAGALLGGFHPPDNIQNDRRPGGMPLGHALAGTWQRLL